MQRATNRAATERVFICRNLRQCGSSLKLRKNIICFEPELPRKQRISGLELHIRINPSGFACAYRRSNARTHIKILN